MTVRRPTSAAVRESIAVRETSPAIEGPKNPPGADGPSGRKQLRARRYVHWWFLALPFGLYGVFFLYPLVRAAMLSQFDWSGAGNVGPSIGFGNYAEALRDPYFYKALLNNLFIFAVVFVLQHTVSMGLAHLLNRPGRAAVIYKALLVLPVVTSALSMGFIWRRMLSPEVGVVNSLLGEIGLTGLQRDWLGDPSLALFTVSLIVFWQWNGIAMVIYTAGLKSVPGELQEAATVDGASPWRVFRSVTFPYLTPAFTTVTMLSFITVFRTFDLVYSLGGPTGAPDGATNVLGTQIYSDAFGVSSGLAGTPRLSYAIAEGLLMFVIVLSVTSIFNVMMARRSKDL
ncbi:carbohydrate ABC transporter permease [Pseudarthrobacter sp. YAF2]|uniref:carbohydrate ABC transporter permease n=1 Tax=Pseudarthrobacter sp. YAF2 TaxID=3233078 RepID=UPI003F9E647F